MNVDTIENMYDVCVKVKLQDIDVHNQIIYSTGPLHKAQHGQTRVKSVTVSLSRNVDDVDDNFTEDSPSS
jgi:hypothetical protein